MAVETTVEPDVARRQLKMLFEQTRPVSRLLQSTPVQLRAVIHHVDEASYERFYDGSSLTPQVREHMQRWH